MNATEVEALGTILSLIKEAIQNLGFPVVVSVYCLWVFPKQLARIQKDDQEQTKEIITAIHGLQSDIQELNKLLDYQNRLDRYARQPYPYQQPLSPNSEGNPNAG